MTTPANPMTRLYMGTWIGPADGSRGGCSLKTATHHGNLPINFSETEDRIYKESRSKIYSFAWPRTGDQNDSKGMRVQDYMIQALRGLIIKFYVAIQSSFCHTEQDKKIAIITLIKGCLRLHPSLGHTHRVFVLGVLNLLLLRHVGAYCPLLNRRQFTFNSLGESLAAVNGNLVLLVPKPGVAASNELPLHHSPVVAVTTTSIKTPLLSKNQGRGGGQDQTRSDCCSKLSCTIL